jgi:hypothetical protein
MHTAFQLFHICCCCCHLYAGGKQAGPDGKVCYYYNGDPRTIYERLGHAEVVQVALSQEQQSAQQEFQ